MAVLSSVAASAWEAAKAKLPTYLPSEVVTSAHQEWLQQQHGILLQQCMSMAEHGSPSRKVMPPVEVGDDAILKTPKRRRRAKSTDEQEVVFS